MCCPQLRLEPAASNVLANGPLQRGAEEQTGGVGIRAKTEGREADSEPAISSEQDNGEELQVASCESEVAPAQSCCKIRMEGLGLAALMEDCTSAICC